MRLWMRMNRPWSDRVTIWARAHDLTRMVHLCQCYWKLNKKWMVSLKLNLLLLRWSRSETRLLSNPTYSFQTYLQGHKLKFNKFRRVLHKMLRNLMFMCKLSLILFSRQPKWFSLTSRKLRDLLSKMTLLERNKPRMIKWDRPSTLNLLQHLVLKFRVLKLHCQMICNLNRI